MKKFNKNKKVFVIERGNVVQGRVIEVYQDGEVHIKLDDGDYYICMSNDVFGHRKDAERKAEKVRSEHEALMNEVREEVAQVYYADVMEQLPSLI